MQGEFNEFDLNLFFSAERIGDKATFKYEDEVQKWLDLIRGAFMPTSVDNLKLGAQKPPMPFSDALLELDNVVTDLPVGLGDLGIDGLVGTDLARGVNLRRLHGQCKRANHRC